MICLCILIHSATITQLLASEIRQGIFLEHNSVSKLVTDLKFYNENYPKLEDKYNLCIELSDNLNEISTLNELLLDGCNHDKNDLKEVKLELEEKYLNESRLLSDCEVSKPSRVTWFGFGAASAIIVSLISVFLAK